ncbi:hypothetical protein SAMN05877809_101523 [Rhodobacter sp. JA431]|uniref:hypothetical protein n=1 Tax=Rhodobacter sp. JA431 TaxID=570013 RepID=UPI000BD7805E|nr:hypothetical protein [Rhodobacter sp. JA431]SOB92279.1 hypothetical protein SAMN05877809_101523 [Rhodobacter sp. JA431]
MTMFALYFGLVALLVAFFLSRAGWGKMLVLVPFGALVPAYFGTGTMCGADFVIRLTAAESCTVPGAPYELFAAYFVFGLVAVLGASVIVKSGRVLLTKLRG